MGPWIKEAFTFQDLQRVMFKLIDRVPAFAELSPQELTDLLAQAEKCTFGPGDAILNEGSTGHFMYVMIEGAATVAKKDRHGHPSELAALGAGDSFGEMSLVDKDPRSASVTATADCVLIRIPERACWKNPAVSAKIFRNISRILSQRLREADRTLLLRA
jgi:CRP-like cAMP-binding protein